MTDSLVDPESAAKIGTVVAVATGERRESRHRGVDKTPAQLGEPFLPLLLALLCGGADLGAAVSNGGRRGVGCRLNGKCTRQKGGEIVGVADPCLQPGDEASSRRPYAGPVASANVRTRPRSLPRPQRRCTMRPSLIPRGRSFSALAG